MAELPKKTPNVTEYTASCRKIIRASSGPECGSANTPNVAHPKTHSSRKNSGQRCSRAKFFAISRTGLISISRLARGQLNGPRLRSGQLQEQLFQRPPPWIHTDHFSARGPYAFDRLALLGLRNRKPYSSALSRRIGKEARRNGLRNDLDLICRFEHRA